jgi:hypothetical protein
MKKKVNFLFCSIAPVIIIESACGGREEGERKVQDGAGGGRRGQRATGEAQLAVN